MEPDPKSCLPGNLSKVYKICYKLTTTTFNCRKQEHELKINLNSWLTVEEDQIRQKSRENWLILGDKNTKKFHSASKVRHHRNHIQHVLNGDGELIHDVDTIRSLAPKFYQKLFNQDNYIVSFPELVVKKNSY